MKGLIISIIIAIILMFRYDIRTYEEVENSKYFYLSGGKSKDMYKQMKADKLSEDTLKEFVQMEDSFLKKVKEAVCQRIARTREVAGISEIIKERFPTYDFRYHQEHIKQASQPDKYINTYIVC